MKYSSEDFKLAEEYTKISIGMDSLFRRANDDSEKAFEKEGLLPVILTEVEGYSIESWEQAEEMLTKVLKSYDNLTSGFRKEYMLSQIGSTLHLANSINKNNYSFPEKVNKFLQVESDPVDDKELNRNYLKLKKLLSQKYSIKKKFSLREYVQKWENDFYVMDTEKVGNDFLNKSKEKLLRLGFSEVEDINVTIEMVNDVPYNAYCDFFNNKIYLNSDIDYTTFSLKHLAVHEAFPGHSTHLEIRKQRVKMETIPLDASLVFTNTASSVVFEGLAENGLILLDWINSLDDEIYNQLQIIRSKVALNATYKYHVEKLDKDIILDYLKQYGFGSQSWANSRFKFLSHKFRGPFIYSYWRGQNLINNKLSQLNRDDYNDFYKHILQNMHSASSLKIYN